MKRRDIISIALVAIVAAFISSIAAGAIFNSSKQRKEKAPVVQAIGSDFPQVQNNSDYQTIFNPNALDPTQLIKIGTSQNPAPFSGQ